MKADPEVARRLHELMLYDLMASEVYLVQSVLLKDWGFDKLAAHLEHESLHEREHVVKQLERLTYLSIPIDLSKKPHQGPGASARECLEIALEMENLVAKRLNELCAVCDGAKDSGTRALAEDLLWDTEMDHIMWLQTQLRLIDQLGEERYLAEQTAPNASTSEG